MKLNHSLLAGLLFAIFLSGCDRGPAKQPDATAPENKPVAAVPVALATVTMEPTAGRPSREKLEASAGLLMSSVTGKHEEISPIAINGDGAIAIHPGRTVASWIEFDISKLRAITLYPAIRINAACRENPEAGIVGFNLYADGRELGKRVLLNRDDRPVFHIELNGSKTLRIEVDKGNDQITCDWFTVGIGSTQS